MARLDMMPEGNASSRISAGTVIKGEIISPNDIRIDCVFEGKLMVKGKVVVGESATIKDTLGLNDGCTMNGNLHIRRISVELGSTFNGNCKMINESDFEKFSGGEKKPAAPVAGVHTAPAQAQHAAPAN